MFRFALRSPIKNSSKKYWLTSKNKQIKINLELSDCFIKRERSNGLETFSPKINKKRSEKNSAIPVVKIAIFVKYTNQSAKQVPILSFEILSLCIMIEGNFFRRV